MRFKVSYLLAALLSSIVALSACNAQEPSQAGTAKAADKGAISVNGKSVPQSRIDLIVKERVAQGQPDSAEMRQAIKEDLISREIVAQDAMKKGLDKNPEVATQMELAKQAVLVRAYMQDYLKATPVSDAAIKSEYDRIKAQLGDKEYRVRHILVENEAEAKNIIAQLKKGAKFDKLASEKSKDPGSKQNGGDLGWITPSNVVKPFGEAMAQLKKGQTTEAPVQSQFGWHVIRLEDTRDLKAPPFDEVKEQIRQRLQQQQIEKMLQELRAKAKIEQ